MAELQLPKLVVRVRFPSLALLSLLKLVGTPLKLVGTSIEVKTPAFPRAKSVHEAWDTSEYSFSLSNQVSVLGDLKT